MSYIKNIKDWALEAQRVMAIWFILTDKQNKRGITHKELMDYSLLQRTDLFNHTDVYLIRKLTDILFDMEIVEYKTNPEDLRSTIILNKVPREEGSKKIKLEYLWENFWGDFSEY